MNAEELSLAPTLRAATGVSAGTLVHTKDGLKAIQDIQVGDYVLSQPESGVGEPGYRRVLKTFRFE